MTRDWLEVAGRRRSYWLARAVERGAPLLVALHGSGTNGKNMATFCGLAERGPAAGFATVFPDAEGGAWYCGSSAERRAAANDAGFLEGLVGHLVSEGVARPGPIVLVGISNGAFFAEQLARNGLLQVGALALVIGTTLEFVREAEPMPAQAAAFVGFAGTADPLVPYEGGPLGAPGLWGRFVRRRRNWLEPEDARAAPAESVARDWAGGGEPSVKDVPADLPVTRLGWTASDAPPVALYRIEGGGHGWPGGPQYLPARLIGRVARDLDATGIILDVARAAGG